MLAARYADCGNQVRSSIASSAASARPCHSATSGPGAASTVEPSSTVVAASTVSPGLLAGAEQPATAMATSARFTRAGTSKPHTRLRDGVSDACDLETANPRP